MTNHETEYVYTVYPDGMQSNTTFGNHWNWKIKITKNVQHDLLCHICPDYYECDGCE